ncbi:MAG TPA: MFS transporter [Nordella sp.]|nr:MFS transporter [Nordella sp.]
MTQQQTNGLSSVLVLALGTFAVGTDAFIVAAFLPSMAEGLGVTPAAAGQSVTVFALAYALLAPVIATFTAALPRRRLLITALLLLGLANIGSALAPSFGILIATRIVAAAAAATYTPNAGAVAAQLVKPELRARALAIVIGGLSVSTALGVPLGHVASTLLDWRASLALVGLVAFAALIGVALLMPRLAGAPQVSLGQRLQLLRRKNVLIVLPLTVLGMTACYVPFAFTLHILEALLIPAALVTAMLLCYGLGAVAGNYASGMMTDRAGPIAVLIAAYLLLTAIFAALLSLSLVQAASHGALVGLLIFGWGSASWSQTPPQQMRLIAAAPEQAPVAIALNSSAIYAGIALGSAIGGATIGHGASVTLAAGLGLAVVTLIYASITRRWA